MDPTTTTPWRSPNVNRDQKLKILKSYGAGYSRNQIAEHLKITRAQVKYTITTGHVCPKKSTGRPARLSPTQVDELERFICSSRETRRMTYVEVACNFPDWNIGEQTVRNALQQRGYARRLPRKKPPLSERNKRIRKSWAEAHRHWTLEDWAQILWSDETWINDDETRSKHVTKKIREDFEDDCVSDKYQKSNSWMFRGSFAGREKGPSAFWKKDWQKMTAVSYSEKILPRVVQWLGRSMGHTGNRIGFMQDNVPCHKAALTTRFLRAHGVEPILWPAFSPDLNPIEAVWSLTKIFIQTNYPEFERGPPPSRDEVREIVEEA
ncbi:hypothetical protein K3495_g279 [Podosphaera aphanis]|nr:hypothetical protein K3495_g279 [Podosphaera aphanis]